MPLTLHLLGTFQVERDGKAITDFQAQSARALLAYLALEANRPHEREHLVALLWPDAPLEQGLTNLRKALHRLRAAIEPAQEANLLLVTRQSIQLHPESLAALDVAEFSTHLAAVATHRHRHLWACEHCLRHICAALALYRGELLAGFRTGESLPFEEWLLSNRERLHNGFLGALDALSAHHLARGEHAVAAQYLRRWLALEPWREAAHARLMETLWRDSQRDAALHQFMRCKQALAAELGVEPGAETQALARRIQAAMPPPRKPLALPLPATPFVGREAELARVVEQLADPQSRLISLLGPGGAGKTRLALQAAHQAVYGFANGALFVDLVGAGPQLPLSSAIADALGLALQPNLPLLEQLLNVLRDRELLLLIDNLEQLVLHNGTTNSEPAATISAILQAAPQVVVLVTSRSRVNLQAEQAIMLGGLPVPPDAADPAAFEYSGVQLFAERAARAGLPALDLTTIVAICRMVEGLPLGIELAAALTSRHGSAALVATLAAAPADLATDMLDIRQGHRSLRAVFATSWQLLSNAEQLALAWCAAFSGQFSRAAAVAIHAPMAAQLDMLVTQSLLQQVAADRYELHNVTGQLAGEQLVALGLATAARRAHARYYLTQLANATTALHGLNGRALAEALAKELDNLRSAWQYALGGNTCELIAASLEGLSRLYGILGLSHEAAANFSQAIEQLKHTPAPNEQLIAHVLVKRSIELARQGQRDNATADLEAHPNLWCALKTGQRAM